MPVSDRAARKVMAARRTHAPVESPRLTKDDYKGPSIAWPKGLAPTPHPLDAPPSKNARLPRVDAVAMMDTEAEAEAMSDVLTPGHYYSSWYTYARNFDAYRNQIKPGALKQGQDFLGLYFVITVGKLRVLVFKTNLHMHEDAYKLPNGSYSLPIKQMLAQVIDEARPRLFLTTGTSGGVYPDMQLGDVVVTRAARFYCKEDFKNAPFNNKTFRSDWKIPTEYADTAHRLMQKFAKNLHDKGEPATPHCSANDSGKYPTNIYFDGTRDIPPFHPILTTDFFEFGTTVNKLDRLGVAVEMDDACLGLACSEMKNPPLWASVRNLSDPCINGDQPYQQQANCADFYYSKYGYWTTVMSGITTWSILAGFGAKG